MIFNTHSHLNDKCDQIDELLNQCKEYNVGYIAAIGYDYNSSCNALKLANQYKNIYAVCGLQPEEIKDYNNDFNDFIELFDNDDCKAIGEIGLDYYYGKENKERQLEVFEKFLQIACNYQKPIVIHCREAHEDMYNLLYKYYKKLDGIIMHCYTGSVEMMQRYLKLGAYISFSGVVTFKNAKTVKEVAINCPIEKILVETDDPYLTPVPFRGKENKPAYVYYVVQEIANIKNMSFEEVCKITTNNAKKVFHV